MSKISKIIKDNILTVIIIAVIFGGGYVWTYFAGADIGEPCTESANCKGSLSNGECLEDLGHMYCAASCTSNKDCPKNWSCDTAVITLDGKETDQEKKMCFRSNWDCKTDNDCGNGWACKADKTDATKKSCQKK